MILATYTKQPAEVLDYDIDFSPWLSDPDFITSIAVTADAGITNTASTIFNSGKSVKVWLSGGVTATTYKIQVRATTSAGRVKEAEFRIKVKEI